MKSVVKRMVVFFVLLHSGPVHGAEQETKQPSRSDKRTYRPLEIFANTNVQSPRPIELVILQSQKDCAEEKKTRAHSELSVIQDPMLDGHYVSQAAFLARGIEKQIKTALEEQEKQIEQLKQEHKRALRREKRRACRGTCPIYTCSGLTMVSLFVGLIKALNWSSDINKCH